jgi:hypothetical protein
MPTESQGHERTDVSVRGVLVAGVLLVVGAILAQLVVGVQFFALRGARERETPPVIAAGAPEGPPEPRLQTTPAEDLAQVRMQEETILDGYGWEDRAAGVVHIPIARAMELVAREAK